MDAPSVPENPPLVTCGTLSVPPVIVTGPVKVLLPVSCATPSPDFRTPLPDWIVMSMTGAKMFLVRVKSVPLPPTGLPAVPETTVPGWMSGPLTWSPALKLFVLFVPRPFK